MSAEHRKHSARRFLGPEPLEGREMLSGHGFAAFSHLAQALAAVAAHQSARFDAQASLASTAHAGLSATFHVQASARGQNVLTATLTDPTNSAVSGTATYKTYTEDGVVTSEFKVSVKGAAANSTLDISVGSTVIGQVTTDSNGAAKVVFSSNPDGEEQALPANFPTDIAAGVTISVGLATGVLATPTHSGGGCHGAEVTVLRASLTDANSTATATATFQSKTTDDVTTTKFSVSVTGATASSALDIAIDGTVIGQVNTDSTGAGSAVFSSNPTGDQVALPANFPTTISAGATITVGSTSGSFAASSTHSSGFHFGRRR